jgi:hypothetical protein
MLGRRSAVALVLAPVLSCGHEPPGSLAASVAETDAHAGAGHALPGMIGTHDLLAASGPGIGAFSYHHYGTVSRRCAGMGMPQTTPEAALSEEWLARTDQTLAFYRKLRDERAIPPARSGYLRSTIASTERASASTTLSWEADSSSPSYARSS